MAMNCTNCHSRVERHFNYCDFCGTALRRIGRPSATAPIYCTECGLLATREDNFCISCGHRLRRRDILVADVDCSPHIRHSDIAGFLLGNRDHLKSHTDRRLLQEAQTLVLSESRWVWRNAHLTVYGERMKVVFYSGDETNKYVVHLTAADRPTHQVENKGWRLKMRDGFKTAWGWTKKAASKALGALAGATRLAVDWR